MALEFAGSINKWNANERIVEEAFKQCFKSLQFAHNDLLSNPDFMRKLIILHPIAIQYADKSLRMNVDFIIEIYTNVYPTIIHFINPPSLNKPNTRSTPENIDKYNEWIQFKRILDKRIKEVKPKRKFVRFHEDGSAKHYMHKIDPLCNINTKKPPIKNIELDDPNYQDLFNPISIHDIDEDEDEEYMDNDSPSSMPDLLPLDQSAFLNQIQEDNDSHSLLDHEQDDDDFSHLFPDVPIETQVNELSLDDIQDTINSENFKRFLSLNVYKEEPWYNIIDKFNDSLPIEHTTLLDVFIDEILIEYQAQLDKNIAHPETEEDPFQFTNRVKEFELILHTINNILKSIGYYENYHYTKMIEYLTSIENNTEDFDITRIIEILNNIKLYY